MRAFATAAAILMVLTMAFAGCGDDSAEQLDAEELVSRADEICSQGSDRFSEIQSEPAGNAVETEQQATELFDVATDELSDLRELRPPDELRESYDAYLESTAALVDQLELGRDAAAAKDGDAYVAAQDKANAVQPERSKLAQAVGLEVCGQPSGGAG